MGYGITGVAHPNYGGHGTIRGADDGAVQAEAAFRLWHPETSQWYRQLEIKPTGVYVNAVNNFVTQLKTDNNWQYLDKLWIFATEQRQHATISLVNPLVIPLQEQNPSAIVWTAYKGYSNLTTTQFLITNFFPTAPTTTPGAFPVYNYSLNSACFGFYNMTGVFSGTGLNMGATNAAANDGSTLQCFQVGATTSQVFINGPQQIGIPITNSTSLGLFSMFRNNSATVQQFCRGVLNASTSCVSDVLQPYQFTIGTLNTGGGKSGGSTAMQYALGFVGNGNINQLTFNTAVENFLFSIYPWSNQTLEWLAQLTPRPTYAYAVAVDTLIKGLISNGIWYQLDALWCFACETQQHARINIVNPTQNTITEVLSPTWKAFTGYTTNGSSSYLNTNYDATTTGSKFTLNSASLGIYIHTVSTIVSPNGVSMGILNAANTAQSIIEVTPSLAATEINSLINTIWTQSSQPGFYSTSESAGTLTLYYKSVNENAVANTVVAVPAGPMYIGCRNFVAVGPQLYSNGTWSLAYAGSGSINQTTLYTLFQAFATTVGFNV